MVIFSFWLFLCSFALLGATMPDEEISDTENRELQQLPEVDLQQLSEYKISDMETLANDLDTYTVDQFPYREDLLKIYSRLESEQGKVSSRTNYITQDGWIMTYIYSISESQRQRLDQALETIHKKTGLPLVYALVPQKNDMLVPLMEPYYDNYNSEENKAQLLKRFNTRDFIETVDIGTYFLDNFSLEERMKMYYKTDLHWSFEGAYNAAAYTCSRMLEAGILKCDTLPDRNDFTWLDFTGKNYLGDLNRFYSYIYPMNENIPYYSCKDASQMIYTDDTGPVTRETIVGSGISNNELDYNGLSTYNLGYFRVENPSSRSDQKVLILKDSFQNATTDYFTEVFREVDVIDPRFYKSSETILELVNQRDIDIILFFYHQNNISNELISFLQPPIENIMPSESAVFVNGEPKTFEAYNINNNNYFKLRDIAKVISGTEKQFNVSWNGEKSCIELLSGKPYKNVGGEMSKGDGKPKTAISNASTIYKDDTEIDLTAYTIEGNNYFKLRDLGKAFDFNVSWDNESKSIIINTRESYTDD